MNNRIQSMEMAAGVPAEWFKSNDENATKKKADEKEKADKCIVCNLLN